MAKTRPLLDRLLNAPDLTKIVPHLQPDVLHRVIQICGLEDCAEFVALATPHQLARVLDIDLWRARPGEDDVLDADRFAVWLEVLMQCGGSLAAQKLVALDIELITTGLIHHLAVFHHAAVSSYTTLDGNEMPGRRLNHGNRLELGGYVIEAKHASAWDSIVDLLMCLESEQPDYFRRLMRRCVRLSSGPREADGFHHLLQDQEQNMFDLACDREARRQTQGYITPAQAQAFLQESREIRVTGDRPPRSAVARAYFRIIESTSPPDDGRRERGKDSSASGTDVASPLDPGVDPGVVDLLREAGVLTEQPRALLPPAGESASRLASIEAYVESHAASATELAYLANAIVAGCSLQGRPFTTREASDATLAICNLGLDNWPEDWRDRDLVLAFQVGWTMLYREVCIFVAGRLVDVISDIRCEDRDIYLQLHELRRQLTVHLRDGAPWRARHALDVILMLDAPAWAALSALIDECPVMHAAVEASRHSRRAINAQDFEFISEKRQIAVIRDFVASLSSTLTQ